MDDSYNLCHEYRANFINKFNRLLNTNTHIRSTISTADITICQDLFDEIDTFFKNTLAKPFGKENFTAQWQALNRLSKFNIYTEIPYEALEALIKALTEYTQIRSQETIKYTAYSIDNCVKTELRLYKIITEEKSVSRVHIIDKIKKAVSQDNSLLSNPEIIQELSNIFSEKDNFAFPTELLFEILERNSTSLKKDHKDLTEQEKSIQKVVYDILYKNPKIIVHNVNEISKGINTDDEFFQEGVNQVLDTILKEFSSFKEAKPILDLLNKREVSLLVNAIPNELLEESDCIKYILARGSWSEETLLDRKDFYRKILSRQ